MPHHPDIFSFQKNIVEGIMDRATWIRAFLRNAAILRRMCTTERKTSWSFIPAVVFSEQSNRSNAASVCVSSDEMFIVTFQPEAICFSLTLSWSAKKKNLAWIIWWGKRNNVLSGAEFECYVSFLLSINFLQLLNASIHNVISKHFVILICTQESKQLRLFFLYLSRNIGELLVQ